MAPTRPSPGSSNNPIDLTARPLTATIADPDTFLGPAADHGTGHFAGAGTLMDTGPATNTGMGPTTGAVPGPVPDTPTTPTTPIAAVAGGVLSGRVTKTTTPKKTTTTTPKKPTTTTTPKKKPAATATASPGTGTTAAGSPNPPKRGKASSGLPSCLPCRRAKARCDRVVACVRCVKAGKECVSAGGGAAEDEGGGGSGGGGKAGGGTGKACERCKKMKAACHRTETCVRCEKRGGECVMA